MNLRNIYHVAFLLILLTIGCKDPVDVPKPDNDEPVFTASLDIDGTDINYDAGRNGYESEALHLSDRRNRKISFISTIKPVGCVTDCPESLQFRLGSEVPFDQDFNMDRAIRRGVKSFMQERVSDSVFVVLKNNSEGNINGDRWTINDRTMKRILRRESGRVLIHKNGRNEICVEQNDDIGNISKLCKIFQFGQKNIASTYFSMTQSRDQVTIRVNKVSPYDDSEIRGYWNDNRSNVLERTFTLRDIRDREVCFHSDHINSGSKSRTCITIKTEVKKFELKTLFNISAYETHDLMPLHMNGVEIKYINKAGHVFRSSHRSVNNPGKFEIIDITPFTDPSTSKELLRLHVRFNALLRNPSGREIKIKRGEAYIPVPVVKP